MSNFWRMATPTRPWHEILHRFESIEGESFAPMCDLVERIMNSRYAEGLHATTSMHTLVVAITPVFEWGFDVLRIDWEPEDDAFYLAFQEEPFVTINWRRKVPRREGYAALERFLKRKRWFVEYSNAPGITHTGDLHE